jgi:hypothetical protein
MILDLHSQYFKPTLDMMEDDSLYPALAENCTPNPPPCTLADTDRAFESSYDVFGHDPGFTFPIFQADYSSQQQTADCRYSVPEGVVAIPDVREPTPYS